MIPLDLNTYRASSVKANISLFSHDLPIDYILMISGNSFSS